MGPEQVRGGGRADAQTRPSSIEAPTGLRTRRVQLTRRRQVCAQWASLRAGWPIRGNIHGSTKALNIALSAVRAGPRVSVA